ncbi:MAG: AI-2E family transporter, partial [Verrucomicrobiota bacterium]|nr:AI-2E family transporter [Verrucomicrobiota bacterium]
MSARSVKRYPTAWQRQTMWAALSAVFIVLLFGIVGSVIWTAGRLVAFLQPILIPVAIAVILAYLLDPLVTHLSARRMSRTKAIALVFLVAFLAIAALLAWLVPTVSLQGAAVAKELPNYTNKARDQVVDWIYRYNNTFGQPAAGKGKSNQAAKSFVDWLLASPTPVPKVSTTPNGRPESTASPNEAVNSVPPKLSSAERERIQSWVERQIPNLQRQLPYWTEKFWTLLKTS